MTTTCRQAGPHHSFRPPVLLDRADPWRTIKEKSPEACPGLYANQRSQSIV